MSAELIPDLEDYLAEELAPDAAVSEAWAPASEGEADWAARKVVRARRTIEEKQAEAQRVIDRTMAWLEKVTAEQERTASFFEGRLAAWLEAEIAADDSKKPKQSRELPCGVVVKRTAGGKSLVVEDETAFLDWAKTHAPELVTEEVVWNYSKADVKKTFEAIPPDDLGVSKLANADGEQVPGVHIQVAAASVKVVLP